ncbi:MAG: efflux RND transporter permease subunit, partial [Gammaproteobacteria bacterium]|nr:efflux RND transporter permease subunit [Gammaproteobacteria bacterium]
YIKRVVQPQLQTLDGVAEAQILGDKTFAMRVWLNPQKLAAYDLTPQDVARALNVNSYQSAAGQTKGKHVAIDIEASTDMREVAEFRQLVIKRTEGRLVRLEDVASIELGAENDDSAVYFSGKRAVFVAISALPDANPLDVIDRVYAKLPSLQSQLPDALEAKVAYDATRFIRDSINEVIKTVGEATVIVVFVIFLFLGSFRSVIIPVVTIPLSLIGVCFFMLALGYSINLLTLLAMVLAIGLVVDDAIVVVENIHRHIEEGLTPFQASLQGAREIAAPVISMTLTLAAVYAPIGFMGGLTGGLFKEFAFALAGAVVISGVIALTLSPMMCSKLLRHQTGGLAVKLDALFDRLRLRYQRSLHGTLNYKPVTLVMVVVMLLSCGGLFYFSQKELARAEDQGIIFSMSNAPEYATHDYVSAFTPQLLETLESFVQGGDYFVVQGFGGQTHATISGLLLKPWSERDQTQMALVPQMQQRMNQISGYQSVSFDLPTLPGASGLPIQFVITSALDYQVLYELSQELVAETLKSGKFIFAKTDLKYNRPTVTVDIDRAKAAELGISMQEIGQALTTMLSGAYANRFSVDGRSYKIIPQSDREFRATAEDLKRYHIRTAAGQTVPLDTIARLTPSVEPNQRGQFQQLNAVMIEGVMRPGVSMGEALAYLREKTSEIFPRGVGIEYAGQSRQFMQEGNALLFTFFFALILIYLVLAAQFESFRDPFIIMLTVPLSMTGALGALWLTGGTLNVYSQIGLV